jgi:alpha-1,3-rhamnosyl/mannosyltransferase
MRIAIGGISLLGPLTGIGQYTLHLSQELDKLDQSVDLFLGHSWQKIHSLQSTFSPPQHSHSLAQKLLKKFTSNIPRLRSSVYQVRQKKFTQGISNSGEPFNIYHEPNFIPWESDLPTVITIHDLSWIRYPNTHPHNRIKWLNESLPKSIDKAQEIIVVSDFVRQELLDVFGQSYAKKIKRIYNGVSNEFKPISQNESQNVLSQYHLKHKEYFLTVGTIEPRKNLATVLKAYSKLNQQIQKKFPLIIAGERGWLNDELDILVKKIPTDSIYFLGYVPQNDLPFLYSSASIMLYGSIYEGFGLPVLEAMASGTPVITSTASALVEVVGEACIKVPSLDELAWKDAIEKIVHEEGLSEKLSQLGINRSKNFGWDTCAQETLALYEKLMTVHG